MAKAQEQSKKAIQTLGQGGTLAMGIYLLILPVLLAYLVIAIWPSADLSQTSLTSARATSALRADSNAAQNDSSHTEQGMRASSDTAATATNASKKDSSKAADTLQRTARDATHTNPNMESEDQQQTHISLFGDAINFRLSLEARYILLIIVLGALGSYVHAATSFVDFVGNERMGRSWLWWYILRPLIGMALAMIFYCVIRGGFLSAGASSADINLYGIAAVSGLVGMFSKQATDKLREVADNLFRTEKGDERKDKLSYPMPEITTVSPEQIAVGTKSLRIEVKGKNFVKESVIRADGTDLTTDFVSESQLAAQLSDEKLSTPGCVKITVFNPSPGGGESKEVALMIK